MRTVRPKGRHIWAAAGLALLVAFIGGGVTDLGPWYQSLRQPPWKPPDLLFPPAWSLIFALSAWAGALAWARSGNRLYRSWIIGLFALNASLNIGWSILFFQLKRPDFAVIGVVALWLSIVFLIAFLGQRSRLAAGLLLPYLAWVTFAGALNAAVVGLNGPF